MPATRFRTLCHRKALICTAASIIAPATICSRHPSCSAADEKWRSQEIQQDRVGTKRSRSENQEPVDPCAKYNSLKWMLSYASRRDDCNAEDSCVFVGRSITGACILRDPSAIHKAEKRATVNMPLVLPESGKVDGTERSAVLRRNDTVRRMQEGISELETELDESDDEDMAARRFLELMDALHVEGETQESAVKILREEGLQAVQVYVQNVMAKAAAEELRFQNEATEAFAKDFLVEVLSNPELPGKMGTLLEEVFKDPALSNSTRHLIYTAVALEHTYGSAWRLTRNQVTWLLSQADWMDDQALRLCIYLLRLPETERSTVNLVAWALREPGMADPPAVRALTASLPMATDSVKDGMVWAITSTLKSDWALEWATATAKSILQARSGTEPESEQSYCQLAETSGSNKDVEEVMGKSNEPPVHLNKLPDETATPNDSKRSGDGDDDDDSAESRLDLEEANAGYQ